MNLVGLVGPGRVGRAIVTLLPRDEYQLGPVVSSSLTSARRAVREMQMGIAAKDYDALASSEIILVAVPDHKVDGVVEELRGADVTWEGKTVLLVNALCSGESLAPLRRRKAIVGSICPLFVVHGQLLGFGGVHFIGEGDARAASTARRLIRSLGGEFQLVTADQKVRHATAVSFASEIATGLLEAAVRELVAGGFSRKRAVDAITPILLATIENFGRTGANFRPGPLLREETAAVRARVGALAHLDPVSASNYVAWALQTLRSLDKPEELLNDYQTKSTDTNQRAGGAIAGGQEVD